MQFVGLEGNITLFETCGCGYVFYMGGQVPPHTGGRLAIWDIVAGQVLSDRGGREGRDLTIFEYVGGQVPP